MGVVGGWLYAMAVLAAAVAVMWGTGTKVEVWVEVLESGGVVVSDGGGGVSDTSGQTEVVSPPTARGLNDVSLGRDPPSRDIDVLFYGNADGESTRQEIREALVAQGGDDLTIETCDGEDQVTALLPRAKIFVVDTTISVSCLSWLASQKAFIMLSEQLNIPQCEKEVLVAIPHWQMAAAIRRFLPLARTRFEASQRAHDTYAASSWASSPDPALC